MLAFRKNFHAMTSLTEVSVILRWTEEDSGSSALALASSSALQFPGIQLCSGIQISVTLKRPERNQVFFNVQGFLHSKSEVEIAELG